jgi:hypothetical protein
VARKKPSNSQKKKMKIPKCFILILAAACVAPSGLQAHISYSGRNFGTDPVSMTIGNQAASSAFGWADATDADWGDSHRFRYFRFTLTTSASIMISVARGGTATQTGAADTFLPAFSLFSGLAQRANNEGFQQGVTFRTEALAHDGAALSIQSLVDQFGSGNGSGLGGSGKEGSFRSLDNWSIGNDPTYNTAGDPASGILIAARLASFNYIGHAADGTSANFGNAPGINGDGNADGSVAATFNDLAAGDYSLFVGGANYAAQLTETATYPTYAFTATVQTVPEPSTWALLALGGAALGVALRKKLRR